MTKTIVTIRRPNGSIEELDVSAKFPSGLTDTRFSEIQQATKAAGRGWCLGYVNQRPEISAARMARIDVDCLYGAAEAAADHPVECITIRKQADDAMTAWRLTYPVEAAAEDAERVAAAAERKARTHDFVELAHRMAD